MESQKVDGFNDIIGGVGLSNLAKNRKSNYQLRNCILFGCKASQMTQMMKKSYLVVVYNPSVWKSKPSKATCVY